MAEINQAPLPPFLGMAVVVHTFSSDQSESRELEEAGIAAINYRDGHVYAHQ